MTWHAAESKRQPPAGTLAHLSGCHPFTENGLASKGVHLPLPLTPCTPGQLSVRLDAIPTNGVLKRLVHFKGVRLDPSKSYSYSSTHRFVWMMPLKNLSDVSIVCLTSAWAKTSAAVKVYPGVFGLPSFGNAWCCTQPSHAPPPAGTLAHLSGCHPFTENGLASRVTTFRPCTPGQRSDRLDATLTNGVLKRLVQGHQSPPTEDQKQAAQHKTHETRHQSRQVSRQKVKQVRQSQ